VNGTSAIAVLLLAALALGSDPLPSPAAAGPNGAGMPPLRLLLERAGLDSSWRDFLMLVASAESTFNPAAVNDDPGEKAAAATAYDRNAKRLAGCSATRAAYVFGSGGYFGFLPAIAVFQLGAPWSPCIDPAAALFDTRFAVAVAIGYARGLTRYHSYRRAPSWARMRAGWRSPKSMSNEAIVSEKATRLEDEARRLGLAFSDALAMPPPLPTPAQALERLGVA
jgi:hypothetical protein